MVARLRAGDAAIAIVVVQIKGLVGCSISLCSSRSRRRGHGSFTHNHVRGRATRQDVFQCVPFTFVDGQVISLPNLDNTISEPALSHSIAFLPVVGPHHRFIGGISEHGVEQRCRGHHGELRAWVLQRGAHNIIDRFQLREASGQWR